jgi:hypothetical protein
VRLLLIGHAASASPGALARAAELGRSLPRPRIVMSGPEIEAVQTARALGMEVTEIPELHGWQPEGESVDELLARVREWLSTQQDSSGTRAAVTDPAVVRAAVAVALVAPTAFGRIDVAPCSVTELSFRDGRWQLAHVNWEPALLHIPQRRGRRRAPTP